MSSSRGARPHVARAGPHASPSWEHARVTSSEDPEQRIADLEKQLADARRIADLEAQLAPRMFGMGRTPTAPVDTRLADAPRRVPLRFVLAEMLPFRWWYLFALFMVAIPPMIVWLPQPQGWTVTRLRRRRHRRLGRRHHAQHHRQPRHFPLRWP